MFHHTNTHQVVFAWVKDYAIVRLVVGLKKRTHTHPHTLLTVDESLLKLLLASGVVTAAPQVPPVSQCQ